MGTEHSIPVNEVIKSTSIFEEGDKEKLYEIIKNYSEYCSACNDVPKALMLFPSYRQKCSEARHKLHNNTAMFILESSNKEKPKDN